MTKLTVGVYKSFKNSGVRNHRKKTKKKWCHYFWDDDSGEWEFGTEFVSTFKALILKRKVYKKVKFICLECGEYYTGLVKKASDEFPCPNCDEEEYC